MKIISRFCCMLMLLILVGISFFVSVPAMEVNAATAKKTEILFVGNSKTASHGSPAKSFEKLANDNKKNVNVTICAKGGNTLLETVNTPAYAALITQKKYDIVILQEGIKPYLGKTTANYNKYVKGVNKIVELVRQKNPSVKIFIRQVWVGKEYGTVNQIAGAGQSTGKFWYRSDETCTTEDKKRAYKNTVNIAKSVGAEVIYDGYVMGSYNNRYIKSEDGLFRPDKYHQTEFGSALVATAIYASIYDAQPKLKSDTFKEVSGLELTQTRIDRIKTVIKAKYGY